MPVGILTYANIVAARMGFMRGAADAGADSLLIADVPALEAERFTGEMEQAGIEPVLIAAGNTPEPTLVRIAQLSKAYTYCVSRAGITGTHAGGQFDAGLIDASSEPVRRRPCLASESPGPSTSARRLRRGQRSDLRLGDRRSRFETRARRKLCPVIKSSYTEQLGGGMN